MGRLEVKLKKINWMLTVTVRKFNKNENEIYWCLSIVTLCMAFLVSVGQANGKDWNIMQHQTTYTKACRILLPKFCRLAELSHNTRSNSVQLLAQFFLSHTLDRIDERFFRPRKNRSLNYKRRSFCLLSYLVPFFNLASRSSRFGPMPANIFNCPSLRLRRKYLSFQVVRALHIVF